MAERGISRANENRRIRQEALREYLEQRGLLQHVFDLAKKLEDLDQELDAVKVQRLGKVIDTQMKLINKYLPDLKSSEIDLNVNEESTLSEQERIERLSRYLGQKEPSGDRPDITH